MNMEQRWREKLGIKIEDLTRLTIWLFPCYVIEEMQNKSMQTKPKDLELSTMYELYIYIKK